MQRSQVSKSSTQAYSRPGTQLDRPSFQSFSALGVSAGSWPSAGLTSIEVRWAKDDVAIQAARPSVPRAFTPWAKEPSDRFAAAIRLANSASVTQ